MALNTSSLLPCTHWICWNLCCNHVAFEVVPQVLRKSDDAEEGCTEQGRLHTRPDDAGEGCTEQGRLHTKHDIVSVHFYLSSCPAFPL